jgi:hypothetical protein
LWRLFFLLCSFSLSCSSYLSSSFIYVTLIFYLVFFFFGHVYCFFFLSTCIIYNDTIKVVIGNTIFMCFSLFMVWGWKWGLRCNGWLC